MCVGVREKGRWMVEEEAGRGGVRERGYRKAVGFWVLSSPSLFCVFIYIYI